MGLLLDLLLLMVISKEAFSLGSQFPFTLWVLFVLALPFFLGMAHGLRSETSTVVRNPFRVLIGQGITLVTAILFVAMITYQGIAPAFLTLFGVTLLSYFMGRLLGMTMTGLLGLGIVLLVVFLAARFSGFF